MFLYMIYAVIVAIALVTIITQVVLPLRWGTPFFPAFRRRIKTAEERVVEARGELEAGAIDAYADKLNKPSEKKI
jgi:hypothetical protein